MKEAINQTIRMWENQVELKNAYTFGNEDILLDEFAKLFKDTFEIITTAKNEFIYKNIAPVDSAVSFAYLKLLTLLSKYMTYDCMDDESEDKKFTTTCLVAQKLVDYATSTGGYEIVGGRVCKTSTCIDDDDERQGVFTFFREDYPFYAYGDFDEKDKELRDSHNIYGYSYNIYDGNFEEVLNLASQL